MSKLTEARETVGLKSSYVASELGITYSQFNRLENGISKLDKLKLEKLSELYKLGIKKITQIANDSYFEKLNDLLEKEETLNKELDNL